MEGRMNAGARGVVGVFAVLAIILLLLFARGAQQHGVPQNSPTAGAPAVVRTA
jgi:hypothetical protein